MHATTEQLLSIRDGEPVTDHARSHIDFCDVCQAEIARLARVQEDLRALPEIKPDKGLWQAVAVESLDRPDRHRFSWASAAGIAASFVVALVLVSRMDREPAETVGTAVTANNQSVSEPAASIAEVVPPVESISVDQLRTRSRRLENLRRAMPEQPQVVRASTTRTIVDLEDRIALVDYRLSTAERLGLSPQQEKALWQERVYLMNTLVRFEYAQINSPRY